MISSLKACASLLAIIVEERIAVVAQIFETQASQGKATKIKCVSVSCQMQPPHTKSLDQRSQLKGCVPEKTPRMMLRVLHQNGAFN